MLKIYAGENDKSKVILIEPTVIVTPTQKPPWETELLDPWLPL